MKYNFIKIIGIVILLAILFPCCHKKNNPPYTPYAPTGPANGWINNSCTFSSLAIDPNGDSIAIRFDWGAGDTSDWSEWFASGEEILQSHSWSELGTYYVRAQAKDVKQNICNWSLPTSILITETSISK